MHSSLLTFFVNLFFIQPSDNKDFIISEIVVSEGRQGLCMLKGIIKTALVISNIITRQAESTHWTQEIDW